MSGNVALSFTNAFPASFKQNAPLFAAVWWRWSKRACLRCKTPLLHVGLDENESHLTEVDVYIGRSIGANSREVVLALETVCDVLEPLAVACEENSSSSWAIAYTNHIALHEWWCVICSVERLVISPLASRSVCDGVFVKSG